MNRISPWVAALAALSLLGSAACDVVEQARHALPELTTPTANAPAAAGTPGTTAPGAAAPAPSARAAPADTNARPAPANTTARASSAPTDGLLSVREVAAKVRPAVVQIVTEQAA